MKNLDNDTAEQMAINMLKTKTKKWYVLYTASRAEKKVADRLALSGLESYLPIIKEKHKWSDRIRTVEKPLFTSYVFVKCTEYALRNAVQAFQGVAGYVRHEGKPAVIREQEIEEIRHFVQLAEKNRVINEGDAVSIITGPLEKVSGKVLKLGNGIAYLYIESLGATAYVALDNLENLNDPEIPGEDDGLKMSKK